MPKARGHLYAKDQARAIAGESSRLGKLAVFGFTAWQRMGGQVPPEPGSSEMSRPAGLGQAPWPGPHRGLVGRPAGPPAGGARAGSLTC